MPKSISGDDLRSSIGNLMASTPLIAGTNAIAAVGAKAIALKDQAVKAVTPAVKRTADIVLPADRIGNLGKFAHPPRKKGR